jgi:N,N'-diacetylbacillosaminyl-diphospho-undecaprenol alpha-1,3-N-acetylgalactosaminyltransferase
MNKNIKIGFLSHLDSNLYLFRLPIMIELVKNGYEVYAIVPEGKYKDEFRKYDIKVIIYNIDRKSLNILKEFKTLISLYKKLKPLSLDIINSFMLKPNIYSASVIFILRLQKIKISLICSITGLGSFYIDKSIKSKIIKYITLFLYKLSFLVANKVIFQNSDDKEMFINNNISKKEKSILIKSSGIDTSKFNQSSVNIDKVEKIKQSLDIKQDEIIVLMIARLIIHKGVYEYIQANDILKDKYPNVRFLLIGDIDIGNHFNINIDILNNSNVEHLGEQQDIKEFLFLSDIFVLPSYREGVPRTLLEAGAMQKALITTDTIGCKEVVKHNFNGLLVKIQDSCDLANAISVLIEDKEKRELFALNSKKRIKEEFDIKNIVSQYIDIYKKVINV